MEHWRQSSIFERNVLCQRLGHPYYEVDLKTNFDVDFKCNFSDTYISGKTNDLSQLGCDVTQWVKISIRIENKNVTVHLNQKPVLHTAYTKGMYGLQQLRYAFSSAGSVDYISVKSLDGKSLYQDDFNDRIQ